MGVVIFDADLTKLIKYRPQNFTLGQKKVTLSLDDAKIIKVVDDDPLLQQELVDAAGNSVKKSAEEIGKEMKAFDLETGKEFGRTGDMKYLEGRRKEWGYTYHTRAFEAKDEAEKAITKAWKEYKKTQTALRNYKIKVGFKVGLSVVGLASGTITAATAAAGNLPGLIIGITTAAKSAYAIVRDLRAAAKSVVEVYADLYKDVDKLIADYQDMSKKKTTGVEIGKKALEVLTSVSLKSIDGCQTKLATFRAKFSPFETDAHKAARELNDVLESAEEIEKEFKDSAVLDLQKETKPELVKLRANVTEVIENVGVLFEKVKIGRKAAKEIEEKLAILKKNLNEGVYIAAALTLTVALVGLRVWGGLGGPESIEQVLTGAANKAESMSKAVESLSKITGEWVKDA
jgi:hypothetical protein